MSDSEKAHEDAIKQMRESPYNYDDTRWAAFQNKAMDSADLGRIMFLAVGENNTFKEVPKHYPDTQYGLGWKYLHIGFVDLKTGEIEEEENGKNGVSAE